MHVNEKIRNISIKFAILKSCTFKEKWAYINVNEVFTGRLGNECRSDGDKTICCEEGTSAMMESSSI